MATVTSYAEQRLQSINQRIMSSSRLMEIIQRFGLYKEYADKWTTEEMVTSSGKVAGVSCGDKLKRKK